jgi:hypothetical protein
MISEIQRLLDGYLAWLKDKTTLRQIDEWVEITTPYLDRHNDYIQIYAKKDNGGFLLSDDGYTIEDLEQSGCKLKTAKRQELLRLTLNGFGIQSEGNVLQVHATPDNFPLRKHNLVQAIMTVNDLFFLAESTVKSLFIEDVGNWLDLKEVRYTPKVKFTGKSGFDHFFEFVIPKSRRQPERIIQTINQPSRDKVKSVAFSWIDTKEVRPPDSKAFALINDHEQSVPANIVEALKNYHVAPILWSKREDFRDELVA